MKNEQAKKVQDEQSYEPLDAETKNPSFNDFGLHSRLQKGLDEMGYTTPTLIQQQSIPFSLLGRDVLASAQTGTGKTGAFSVPMIQHLLDNQGATALIMTPTRELAMQIQTVVKDMIKHIPILKTALLIGGDSMQRQVRQLQQRPRIIIGTPGRINDHLRSMVFLNKVSFMVLDEADRMLDMGFTIQLEEIYKFVPTDRQTLMFSATFAPDIVKFAQRYLQDPERVAIEPEKKKADNIDHAVRRIKRDDKYAVLSEELNQRTGSVIIFVKTKIWADKLAARLSKDGFKATAIHGDLHQHKRTRVLKNFRDAKFRILVATDVAARGLDVPHIEHVVNYELPQNPEDYVHRIGRTARAGAKGHALCLLTDDDAEQWWHIHKMLELKIDNPFGDQKPRSSKSNGPRGRGKGRGGRSGGGFKSGGGKGRTGFKDRKPRTSGHAKSSDRKTEAGQAEGGEKKRNYAKKRPFGSKPGSKTTNNNGEGKRRTDGNKKPFGDRKKSLNKGNSKPQGQKGPRRQSFGAKGKKPETK